ncbi:MAG: hypothetical protein JO167_00020 [Alphaproteobacteria bacterium]|nr:hypothetical protein [Alphaproteobacteria bacterium]MBV9904739.1 hypothetical protein [Alphaproteobacteria bacterium]
MRIAVIGTSGAGKSTMGRRLATAFAIPYIELDAINWQAGWRDLNTHDPEEFRRRVTAATASESWVSDGNYGGVVGPVVMGRATYVVWLDYERPVVMRRVIWRSIIRVLDRKELWPGTGNRERFIQWFTDPDHPIRWAWRTHAYRRARIEAMLDEPQNKHLKVFRLCHPRDARAIERRLKEAAAESAPPPPS